jgi:hypothetical protein
MDVQLNALCVSIIHINTWRHVNLEACLEHASWYINSNFRSVVKQSLTIAVMTGVKDAQIQVVSLTIKAAELRARINHRANGTDNKFSHWALSLI